MDLTEGAVRAIQEPAREAERLTKAVTIIDTPDPRKKFIVQGSQREEFNVPAPIRKHIVCSLAGLIEYADTAVKPVVWHSHKGVTLVLDDSDRRDTVVFNLVTSNAWNILHDLDTKGTLLSQRDLIRILRINFGASEDVIVVFRKLNFQTLIAGEGNVQKGKESLGKSIEAEIKGTSDLPDELFVDVPIFDNQGERQTYRVRLLLEYDAQNQRIQMVPEPGLLSELEELHQADIHKRLVDGLGVDLEENAIPVYFGTM